MKPRKPYDDFPLFPHSTGRWCKKIDGKHVYFGPWDDPDGALARYQAYCGNGHQATLTVKSLCNQFLNAKRPYIVERTWKNYEYAARFVADNLKTCPPTPLDFTKLRTKFPKHWGPKTVLTIVQRTRVIFKWAWEQGLLEHPPRFGDFKVPSAKALRLAKKVRLFTAPEIRAMLKAACPELRSAILLGINCGFGNADIDRLPLVNGPILDYPRPKTGIPRRCPLWPETMRALTAARPNYHGQWALNKAFARLHPGGFYTLRHTFRTVADEVNDRPAIDLIMGHVDNTMGGHYRQRVDDKRLLAVTNHVRKWLRLASSV